MPTADSSGALALTVAHVAKASLVTKAGPQGPAASGSSPIALRAMAPTFAPEMQPNQDPSSFLKKVSEVLTCEDLETMVGNQCGTKPIYQAVAQFGGNREA